MLEFLLHHGVGPQHLAAVGYADQNPVAPNTTAAGRALNRRVDIVVIRSNTTSVLRRNLAVKGKLKIILPVLLLLVAGGGGGLLLRARPQAGEGRAREDHGHAVPALARSSSST